MKASKIIVLIIGLFITLSIQAQQTPQTTFFNDSRAFWNPAYTGVDQQLAFNTFVRQQWLGFGVNAPRLINLDFQYPFVDYNMAASGAIHYDQTGPVSKRGPVLNYAYQLKDLGRREGQLSLGVSAGAQQYVFNPSNEVLNQEGDPSLTGGSKSAFFSSIGGGFYYINSTEEYRNNTNFFLGGSFLQGYETNVLIDSINQKRVNHLILDLGSKIYGNDYLVQPSISINLSAPEIINVLAGVTFEMRDQFWAGVGYSSIQEFTIQGGYILDEVAGRDTRLKIGALANIGLGERIENFGPGMELFVRYELDMD